MFFILGISPKSWQLPFQQQGPCPVCGRLAHFEVWVTANCLALFFIPVFRFGKQYSLVASCCGASCELPPSLGKAIARGEVTSLDLSQLQFDGWPQGKRCPACGAEADPSFQFCPHCGARL